MIVVHHLENSRSQRILWLLEELQVPYEVKQYKRNSATMRAPKELCNVHPLGKSPVITDGDTVIAESALIVEYLTEKYGRGRLMPEPATPQFLQYKYWLHYSEASAMTPLLLALFTRKIATGSPWFLRPIMAFLSRTIMSSFVIGELRKQTQYMEDHLAKNEWFCGDTFTAADIEMSFPVKMYCAQPPVPCPKLQAFTKRCEANPAYKQGIEKGGLRYDMKL